MASHHSLALLAILFAICGLIECQTFTTFTTSLNSTHPLRSETFGINYPTNTSVSDPKTKFASVYFNVSEATFVDTSAFFQIQDTIVYKTNSSYTSPTRGPITGAFGTIVPPCFPANRSESYFFSNFNATTDAVYGEATYTYGEVSIPTVTNGSTFEVKCRVLGLSKCNDYYSLSISSTTVTAVYALTVESTNNLTIYFYNKTNNNECGRMPYYITANKREDIGLPVVRLPLDFWLGIQTNDNSDSAQVKMSWILYDADAPIVDNNTPSGNTKDDLPRWALALLIIFGVIIAVLTIVVIVLCVKRSKRAQYSNM